MSQPAGYQRHIDGLRAVAVLCVVFFHYNQTGFSGGFVGVDVFFVISGYLISGLILGEISETGDFSFKRFYIRRMRRLFPALAVTLAFSVLFSIALFSPELLQNFGKALAAAVFSVSNIQFWLESGYFDNNGHLKPLLHTWSLSVEEQFYLLWPALLWLFARNAGPRKQFAILAVLGFLSFGLNYLWVNGQFDEEFRATIFYLTPFRIFELVIGAAAIFLPRIMPTSQWLQEATMATGLALIAFAVSSYSYLMVFPYTAALAPCLGALLVILSPKSRFVGALLTNRLAVGIGLISYSLYLTHWPVLVFYEYYTFVALEQSEYLALIALSCVLSVLMYFFIEKPFRKNSPTRKHVFPQKLFVLSSTAVMLFIGLLGFQIGQSDGKTRLNDHTLSAAEISEASRKRFQLIALGCNLQRLDKRKFCKRERPQQILVIGNSHEPDGYNIFSQVYRRNPEVNLISFGTVNKCDITLQAGIPVSRVEHRECNVRTAMLSDSAFLSTLDGVVYSSNQPFDAKQSATWDILAYLNRVRPEMPVVVLGGYLNTTRHCTDLFHRFAEFSACNDSAHVSYNPFNERNTSQVDESESVKYLYIDKTRLLCKNTSLESCKIDVHGVPAFYGKSNLSLEFSTHLGRRLTREYGTALREWGFPAIATQISS